MVGVFFVRLNISAKGIIFYLGTHVCLDPLWLVFLCDSLLMKPLDEVPINSILENI